MTVGTVLALGMAALGLAATVPAASPESKPGGTAPTPTAIALVVADSAAGAAEEAELAQTLLVFGDSISARFNDRAGDRAEGFWSMLAREVGAEPEVRAQAGSGFVNPGLVGCTGSTFADHLAQPEVAEVFAGAGAVVIEGGRTDTQTCRPGGGYDLVPHREVRQQVDAFLAEASSLRGTDDPCTILVVPWGPRGLADNRDRITRVVSNAAQRYGFTFVDTLGLLTETTTLEDGVHPTRAGNRALTRTILEQSPARGCFS